MNRKIATWFWIVAYLSVSLFIIGIINGFSGAKWFDGGMDLIYGVLLIYLSILLYYSYKGSEDRNIFYVALGFFIVVGDRVLQILLQEIHVKTNYQLVILPWSWAFSDFFMVLGFLLVVYGLRRGVND